MGDSSLPLPHGPYELAKVRTEHVFYTILKRYPYILAWISSVWFCFLRQGHFMYPWAGQPPASASVMLDKILGITPSYTWNPQLENNGKAEIYQAFTT